MPEDGPHAASTADLVQELRDHHDEWEDEFGVSLAVTGFTAVGIDVSNMLLHALIPFGAFVVGLSLILLAVVFRSVWVPIILMGVLFGLAMDYELFLVSRIREEHVHGADAKTAIRRGFIGSGRVVTAAALIMFAVFAAFVPEGDPSIKVIALGLAVGVFVDAFIVRMTLVPAALALLGERAWWIPRWMDRVLPSFDVEGEGIARELAHREWPGDMPEARIASEGLSIAGHAVPDIRVAPGEALLLDPASRLTEPLARVLTGRLAPESGTVTVTGLLLPERAGSLRSRAADASPATLRAALRDRPSLLVLDLRSALAAPELVGIPALRSALEGRAVEAERGSAPAVTVVLVGSRELAERVLPAGTRIRSIAEAHTLTERSSEEQGAVR